MTFFQCPTCKKYWQYSIRQCPECFVTLKKIKAKTAKIRAVSKITIPSLNHPNVPYFILLLEDEEGKKWIQKSKKEYKIGEELFLKNKKSFSAVTIWRTKYDFLEGIEKTIELLGGIQINDKNKILVLPTLIQPSHPYFRDNTSPEFLESILIFLFSLGARAENIKVCSQSFDEIEIGLKATRAGLLDVCQKYKVLPLDLAKEGFEKRGNLEISREIFQNDLILNLPILKIGKAQATENLFFFLRKENFLAQKYLYSEKEILEKLKKELPQILTIAEANHIKDEKGFTHYLNLILGSFSFENLDRVFFELTGQKEPPEFLKEIDFQEIEILGRDLEEVKIFSL